MKPQRLIDADALKEYIDCGHLRNPCEVCFSERDVVDLIDAQPTIDAEPHWIPCSERLPEVRQWVLCQCRAGIMDVLRLTENGSWYKGYPNAEYMGGFVVAWMPLPKPYEGDNK